MIDSFCNHKLTAYKLKTSFDGGKERIEEIIFKGNFRDSTKTIRSSKGEEIVVSGELITPFKGLTTEFMIFYRGTDYHIERIELDEEGDFLRVWLR